MAQPDMLSTAVALHALSVASVSCGRPHETRRFVTGLRGRQGGFHGGRPDCREDCEYTYYGLLALGHLEGP
jgi:hypothetical protein